MPLNTDMARYAEQGYCLLRNAAGSTDLAGIREDVLAAIAAHKATPGYAANRARYTREFAVNLHLRSERITRWLQGSPFREVVAQVLGDEADLRFTSTMTKTGERASHVDWHQDSGYDKDPEHDKFSFWIAVTDSVRDNGCLRIIPGSHAQGLVPHITSRTLAFDKEVETLDESLAEDVEMQPGDMLVLNRYVIHASWPNVSGRLRIGFIAGFMPPKVQYANFENGAFRYFRRGQPVWCPVSDPA